MHGVFFFKVYHKMLHKQIAESAEISCFVQFQIPNQSPHNCFWSAKAPLQSRKESYTMDNIRWDPSQPRNQVNTRWGPVLANGKMFYL